MHRNSCPKTYRFPTTNKIPPHCMLNSPTSAAYCTLFFLLGPLTRKVRCDDQRLQNLHGTYVSCGIREDLLVRVMAAADVGLPSIGDRVYQNMVHGYHVYVEVADRHIEPFLTAAVFQGRQGRPGLPNILSEY